MAWGAAAAGARRKGVKRKGGKGVIGCDRDLCSGEEKRVTHVLGRSWCRTILPVAMSQSAAWAIPLPVLVVFEPQRGLCRAWVLW